MTSIPDTQLAVTEDCLCLRVDVDLLYLHRDPKTGLRASCVERLVGSPRERERTSERERECCKSGNVEESLGNTSVDALRV